MGDPGTASRAIGHYRAEEWPWAVLAGVACWPRLSASVQFPSPRLFFERSPPARTSKGFLITGMGVSASRSSSRSEAQGSAVPAESTQLLSPLHVEQFKSRRQSRRTFSGPVNSRFGGKRARDTLASMRGLFVRENDQGHRPCCSRSITLRSYSFPRRIAASGSSESGSPYFFAIGSNAAGSANTKAAAWPSVSSATKRSF